MWDHGPQSMYSKCEMVELEGDTKRVNKIIYMIKESGTRIANSNLPLVKLSKATGDVTQEALIHSHKRANKISHRFKAA